MVDPVQPRYVSPLSSPRDPATDVSWTFSLARAPGSEVLAARMSYAALEILGVPDGCGGHISGAIELACRYVLRHGLARRFRVTVGIEGPRCLVAITDYGYDQPGSHWWTKRSPATPDHEVTGLCRALGDRMDTVQVHHALDGAVLVRFRSRFPES